MRKIDFWANVRMPDLVDCWPWHGRIDECGYGRVGKRSLMAHRLAYEEFIGPIPAGMQLDHVCHTRDLSCRGGVTCPHRRCVNPAHLEVVTQLDNVRRGRGGQNNVQKTHCPRGHPYDVENTYVWPGATTNCRSCKACERLRRAGRDAGTAFMAEVARRQVLTDKRTR